MAIKYEYKSICCKHEYTEIRNAEDPMWFPICNNCSKADYELVNETVLADEAERVPGPEPVIIIDNPTQELEAPTV